jgi:hypothetical protein
MRAGLHTGECEFMDNKVSGVAVHIGARVASQAQPGEVLVSSTVKDLVAGSGIEFEDRGVVTLRGVPDEWRPRRSVALRARTIPMPAALRIALIAMLTAGLAASALPVTGAGGVTAAKSVPAGTFDGCPRHVLRLAAPLASYTPVVRNVVQHFVTTTFARKSKSPKSLIGARTDGVWLVRKWLPSGWIKGECGKTVWQRSLAVGVYLPAADLAHNPIGHCNDCDHLVFIVSLKPSGWAVWGIY